jgi:hypothetical protein
MSHWAEIDENNVVIRVIVCDNNDPNGDEGYQWIMQNLGGNWVQTSYNSNFRKHFASIGFTYNEELDVFIPPKPFESWIFNETIVGWTSPVEMPNDDNNYYWDEDTLSWILIDI